MLLLVVPFALGVLIVVEGAVLPVVTLLLLDPATEVAAADKEDCFNAAASLALGTLFPYPVSV